MSFNSARNLEWQLFPLFREKRSERGEGSQRTNVQAHGLQERGKNPFLKRRESKLQKRKKLNKSKLRSKRGQK